MYANNLVHDNFVVHVIKVLHKVPHVFLHIPDDLSATKFELPVEGVAELLQKGEELYLAWNPTDITHNDVACLYASETDAWTMVDNGKSILC